MPAECAGRRHHPGGRGRREGHAQPRDVDVRKLDPPSVLEITGDGVGGTKYALTMKVAPTDAGCAFTLRMDLGGRPLFGPIGVAAARAVKGDIARSIERFEALYA
jgi:polyketide cyclase/dehydrase/lipid transport protein